MTISIEKYAGDYTDLKGLALEGNELADIAEHLDRWDVYVGYEDDVPKGFFVLSKPEKPETLVALNPFRSLPYVTYLFNSGSAALRTAMASKVREVVLSRGHQFFTACNFTGGSDAAWEQIFQKGGAITRLGSVFQFDAQGGA